jgi:hypothetical protein
MGCIWLRLRAPYAIVTMRHQHIVQVFAARIFRIWRHDRPRRRQGCCLPLGLLSTASDRLLAIEQQLGVFDVMPVFVHPVVVAIGRTAWDRHRLGEAALTPSRRVDLAS